MKVQGENYRVIYTRQTATVTFSGELTLMSMAEYGPIKMLLDTALDEVSWDSKTGDRAHLELDLRSLTFLNSSGINVLFRFTIKVRQASHVAMTVKGAAAVPWQRKSLVNLKRLFPAIVIELS